MTSVARTIQVGSKGDSGANARLLSLDDLDGRTRAAQALNANILALEADLGGADHLSAGERQMVHRAALAGVMCEDLGARWLLGEPVDPALFAQLANAERRLLAAIGLNRLNKRSGKAAPELEAVST